MNTAPPTTSERKVWMSTGYPDNMSWIVIALNQRRGRGGCRKQ